MNFGIVAFSQAPFSTQQFEVLDVAVTGTALGLNQTDVVTVGHANVSLTGSAMAFSITEVITIADANLTLETNLLTSSIGIANGIGWATVDSGTAQTWTSASTGTAQTWVPVDEVEKVA